MQTTIQRYHKQAREGQMNKFEIEQYMQQVKHENANMAKKIELLEHSQRKLLGHDLSSCSVEELQEIDSQLERSLRRIVARKEKILLEENAMLSEKCGAKPSQPSVKETVAATLCSQGSLQDSEVETELIIGLPEIRCL
ncbi:hypothetical protein FNV43_RR24168 [Rhamnella rubrinervis]|uniref:K-box domain-containing protein n=1 Tax=Rhamnella rubrinervis TaxID=2594499 RepID=A0A8K0DQM4_9ROSA|nr:hypothetical protein FNV43_RR24168 [Rhamnella rubrinervis]